MQPSRNGMLGNDAPKALVACVLAFRLDYKSRLQARCEDRKGKTRIEAFGHTIAFSRPKALSPL